MTEPLEAGPLTEAATRVLAFATEMTKERLGLKTETGNIVIAQADLIATAQGFIDLEILVSEQKAQGVEQVVAILESDLTEAEQLQQIRELCGVAGYPPEFIEILMNQGLTYDQAIATLSAMNSVVSTEDDVDFGEDVEDETQDETQDDDPAFTVIDPAGTKRVIRPIVNPNPHVPHVDVDKIIGARTGANGRRDMGGLNEG